MKTQTTRRSIVGALVAAPVAALPAVAGARPVAPLSPTLAAAIQRFQAAHDAVENSEGPEDISEDVVDAETAAVEALALAPCASAEELLAKLRNLARLRARDRLWRHLRAR